MPEIVLIKVTLTAEVAAAESQRATLMTGACCRSTAACCLCFTPRRRVRMMNTYIPLSIAFDNDGVIINIADMKPLTDSAADSARPVCARNEPGLVRQARHRPAPGRGPSACRCRDKNARDLRAFSLRTRELSRTPRSEHAAARGHEKQHLSDSAVLARGEKAVRRRRFRHRSQTPTEYFFDSARSAPTR